MRCHADSLLFASINFIIIFRAVKGNLLLLLFEENTIRKGGQETRKGGEKGNYGWDADGKRIRKEAE
jgi:hypothetical protein